MLSRDVEGLLNEIDQQGSSFVIQRYLENPLLLPGHRKFDVRVWVVLDPRYDIYAYSEGVVRTCSGMRGLRLPTCTLLLASSANFCSVTNCNPQGAFDIHCFIDKNLLNSEKMECYLFMYPHNILYLLP